MITKYILTGLVSAAVIVGGWFGFQTISEPQTFGAQPAITVPQGGTGLSEIKAGSVPYGTGVSALRLATTSTTTASCAGTTSCSSFTIFGSSPITITGSGAGSGTISTSSDLITGQSVYVTGPSTVASVATTTLTFSGPFNGFANLGYLINGSNSTVSWYGLATTSNIAVSQVLYGTSASGVASVATTTLTATGPLSLSNTVAKIGGSNSVLSIATTSDSLFSGTAGQVLAFLNGGWFGAATTTFSSGLTYLNGNVTNTGVIALGGVGQQLTGSLLIATSSTVFNGLTASTTVTCVTLTCTFANTLAGLLGTGGGGTGLSTYTTGDLIYSSATNVLAKRAIGTGGFVLASVDGLPAWVATSSITATSPFEIATTTDIAVPQVAYFTKTSGLTTLGSVATGTISSANSALTVTGSRYALGGAATFTIATTSTNMFTGTAGQVLAFTNTGWTGVATTTFSTGLTYTSATNVVTNAGVISLGGVGQALTGALVIATSSTAFNGLTASTTVTCATLTCTFANTLVGLLGVGGGGTGATSFSGSTLIASNSGGTALVSTTTPSAITFTATSTTATSTFPIMSCTLKCLIESAATLALDVIAGMIGIDTTSGQFRWSDGTSTFSAVRDWEIAGEFGSTTLDRTLIGFNTATSTRYIGNRLRPVTMTNIFCKTSNGTMIVEVGDGAATATPALVCTTGGTNSTLSANNTWTTRENIVIGMGSATTATKANGVTWTLTAQETQD